MNIQHKYSKDCSKSIIKTQILVKFIVRINRQFEEQNVLPVLSDHSSSHSRPEHRYN